VLVVSGAVGGALFGSESYLHSKFRRECLQGRSIFHGVIGHSGHFEVTSKYEFEDSQEVVLIEIRWWVGLEDEARGEMVEEKGNIQKW
jgi:hypothetical protein